MRHADVELHRRTVHPASSTGQTATFVVSAGHGGGVQRLATAAARAGNSKRDPHSLESSQKSNRGQHGKQRKFLCVMCDASFLQKAHLVSTVNIKYDCSDRQIQQVSQCCTVSQCCKFSGRTALWFL